MSDYEVTLVNDNMQEFFVRFHGPQESESEVYELPGAGGQEGRAGLVIAEAGPGRSPATRAVRRDPGRPSPVKVWGP